MKQAVQNEIWRLVTLAILVLLVGFISGQLAVALVLGLSAATLYFAANLFRLTNWLEKDKTGNVPDAIGLWGEVFNRLYAIDRATGRTIDELQSMATRFQQAAVAFPDAIIILRKDQDIEWANPMAEKLLAIRINTDIGRPITNLVRHPGFRSFLEKPYSDEQFEMKSPAMPSRSLSLRRVPYGARQELLIARDITRVQRLETMRSQFVANVSHELRSPITVLSGYLETLKDVEKPDPEVMKQAINTMYSQAKRMERLVSDLLALSQLETESTLPGNTEVKVAALLAGLIESAQMLSGEAEHRIELDADESVNLVGNQSELHSVFANLINNAVRYTPAGGVIKVSWQASGAGALFSVTDTGPGIAPQHIPRLTERFYRVDVDRSRETGGTGLGLAIVKHVLDRHDGRLNIISELGKGSTFECRFPAERVKKTSAGQFS